MMCSDNFVRCLESQCCSTPGWGCYKRISKAFAQCRPLTRAGECMEDTAWTCPGRWEVRVGFEGAPPLAPSPSPPPLARVPSVSPQVSSEGGAGAAFDFARRLGRGVNIASSAIDKQALSVAEFKGLAARGVQHVRIAGGLIGVLLNYSTCPASTIEPASSLSKQVLSDSPAMMAFKQQVEFALEADLLVVLDPLHTLMMVEQTHDAFSWMWEVLLECFSTNDFPVDRVAFEIVNEPGSWHLRRVQRDFFSTVLRPITAQIHAAQPTRIVVVPGEMGHRCDITDWASSSEGLLMDAHLVNELASRQHPSPLLATFHYYEPRNFTNQLPPERLEWGTPVEHDLPRERFRVIRAALDIPTYLGELGLNLQYVDPASASAWLREVSSAAAAAGIPYSLWTYFLTDEAVVSATGAMGRLREWECSEPCAAAFNFSVSPSCSHRRARRRAAASDDVHMICGDGRPFEAPAPTLHLQPDLEARKDGAWAGRCVGQPAPGTQLSGGGGSAAEPSSELPAILSSSTLGFLAACAIGWLCVGSCMRRGHKILNGIRMRYSSRYMTRQGMAESGWELESEPDLDGGRISERISERLSSAVERGGLDTEGSEVRLATEYGRCGDGSERKSEIRD